MGEVRIGTSGWAYDDWKGPFYPEELRAADRLGFVARRFPTLEINASFYRMPTAGAVARWREETPEGFVFAWKASRYITHNKKLTDPQESLAFMLARTGELGPKLGPILFQLPPGLHRDDERLAAFLKHLPHPGRFAFEFRHPSWYEAAIFDLLRDHGAGFCISDHHNAPAPFEVTSDFVYLRGHGPGGRYRGRYSTAALEVWADRIREWRGSRDVFVYFDNDIKSAAPMDARRLIDLCGAT